MHPSSHASNMIFNMYYTVHTLKKKGDSHVDDGLKLIFFSIRTYIRTLCLYHYVQPSVILTYKQYAFIRIGALFHEQYNKTPKNWNLEASLQWISLSPIRDEIWNNDDSLIFVRRFGLVALVVGPFWDFSVQFLFSFRAARTTPRLHHSSRTTRFFEGDLFPEIHQLSPSSRTNNTNTGLTSATASFNKADKK